MKYTIYFLLLLFLAACSSSPSLDGCYLGNVGQDTAFLSLSQEGTQVSGNLSYQFYEKDQNSGSVQGEVLGDSLLLLSYTFMSEGMESKRQVAFLHKDGKLIEGTGALKEQDGGFTFEDIAQLNFGNSFELASTDCNNLPAQ